MAKYRKKPVVVEAEPYRKGLEDRFCFEEYIDNEALKNKENLVSFKFREVTEVPKAFKEEDLSRNVYPYIVTLEGSHYIAKGDYIITGVKGERYPCKKDIFEMTYEEV